MTALEPKPATQPQQIGEFLDFQHWLVDGTEVWICPKCNAEVENPMMGCDECDYPPF